MCFRGSEVKPEKYDTRNCYPKQSTEVFEALDKKLNELIQCKTLLLVYIKLLFILNLDFSLVTNLRKAPHRVCIVYDDRMQKHCDVSDNTHPEKPVRISSIYKNHEEHGLLERCYLLQVR